VLLSNEALVALQLFVLHTWAIDAAYATPYLAIVSAEKQSGKTKLLEVLEPEDRALWATALYTGLRMGELSALSRADVDLGAGVIRVHRGWDAMEGYIPTKNRKPRSVPVAAVLRDHLDEHLLSRDADEHVFGAPRWVSRAGTRAHERWKERGLDVIDLHEARHTYASFAIAAGLNAKTLSMYMGHATIQITLDLYGHLFPGAEAEAASLLDAYFARNVGGQTVARPERLAA
jgi:integrase